MAGHSFLNPDTGERRDVSDPRELETLVAAGWRPENPDAEVPVFRLENGAPTATPMRLGDLNGYLQRTGTLRLLDRQSGAAVIRATQDRRQQAIDSEFGGTAFLQSFGDVASAGMLTMAEDLIDPSNAQTRERILSANPTASMAGTAAGFVPALLEGGAGLSGAAGRVGVGGISREVGMLVGERLAPRLGLGARGAAMAGLMTEEVLAGGLLEGVLALQQNRPYSAENALMDMGIGVSFGLGIRGLGAGRDALGERFVRRAEATPGGRNAAEGLLDQADTVDGRRSLTDINAMQAAPQPGMEWAAKAMGVGANLPPGLANPMTHRAFRELALDADDIIARRTVDVATGTEALRNDVDALTQRAKDQSWLDAHTAELDAVPAPQTRALVQEQVGGINTSIERWIEERGALAPREELEALLRVRTWMDDFTARTTPRHTEKGVVEPTISNRDLFERLVSVKNSINQDLPRFEARGGMGTLEGVIHEVRALAWNKKIWGRVGELQEARDRGLVALGRADDALLSVVGRAARLQPGERIPSAAAVGRLIKKTAGEDFDALSDMTQALKDYSEAARGLGEVAGMPPELAQAIAARADLLQRAVDEGAAAGRANKIVDKVVQQETRSHGALSMMGFGGGLGVPVLAGVLGGPVGALAGAIASVPFAFLVRPGGSLLRMGRLRQGISNVRVRVDAGLANVRQAATKGFLSRQSVGRMVSRGVQSYYNLDHPKKRMNEFVEMRRDIRQMVESPELMMDRLAYTTAALEDLDPELADQVSFSAIRALFHLHAHMPEPLMDPLSGEEISVPPSIDALEAFNRRYAVVEDPLVVLDRLATGMLQPDEVDTLRVVYPQMYGSLVAGVADTLSQIPRDKMRYDFRVQVGSLFGFDTDYTMGGSFIAAMQNAGVETSSQDQAARTPHLSRPLSVTQNTSTTLQRMLDKE